MSTFNRIRAVRWIMLLLLLLVILSCLSCTSHESRHDAEDEEYVLFVPRSDSLWSQNAIHGFLDTCKEYDIAGTVLNFQMDENLMMLNLSQVIHQGVDGIVLMSPEPTSGWSIMSSALSSNTPIISMDEKITDSQGRQLVPYIGIDNYAAGEKAGIWAVRSIIRERWVINENISYRIAIFTYNDFNGMKDRTDSFVKVIHQEIPEISEDAYISVDCDNGSAVDGLLAMQGLLTENPGISHWFVFGATANSVIGAVRALEQVDLAETSIACWIDAGIGFKEFSEEKGPACQALVYVDTYKQGSKAVELLYGYHHKHSIIPPASYLQIDLITKDTRCQGEDSQ